jgi:hypothetical protein
MVEGGGTELHTLGFRLVIGRAETSGALQRERPYLACLASRVLGLHYNFSTYEKAAYFRATIVEQRATPVLNSIASKSRDLDTFGRIASHASASIAVLVLIVCSKLLECQWYVCSHHSCARYAFRNTNITTLYCYTSKLRSAIRLRCAQLLVYASVP